MEVGEAIYEDPVDRASEVYIESRHTDLFKYLKQSVRNIPCYPRDYYFEVTSTRHHFKKVFCIAIYKINRQIYLGETDYASPFKKIILPKKYNNPILLRHLVYYYTSKTDPEWGKRNNVNSFNIHVVASKRFIDPVRRLGVS